MINRRKLFGLATIPAVLIPKVATAQPSSPKHVPKITLRSEVGRPLTFEEMDENFRQLTRAFDAQYEEEVEVGQ